MGSWWTQARISSVKKIVRIFGPTYSLLLRRIPELPLRLAAKHLARVFPRDHRLILFGADYNTFTDNTAYQYLAMPATDPEARSVWVTSSKQLAVTLEQDGLDVVLRTSLKGIWSALRAGTYVYGSYVSDINGWFYEGARLINLWHGIPLKRIEHDIHLGPLASIYGERNSRRGQFYSLVLAERRQKPDILLSSSRFVSEKCLQSAFQLASGQILEVGLPRNDHLMHQRQPSLLRYTPSRDLWASLAGAATLIGFFPTWRDSQRAEVTVAETLEVLRKWAVSRGGTVLYKPHDNSSQQAHDKEGVLQLRRGDDLTAFLGLCHILVTDYSSVAFDFLLLNRPIIYYTPDYHSYAATRGFYFDREEGMPGPIAENLLELREAIGQIDELDSMYKPKRERLRGKIWNEYVGQSAEQVLQFLLERKADEYSSVVNISSARKVRVF